MHDGPLDRLLGDIDRRDFLLPEADILTPARRKATVIDSEEDNLAFFELCLETVFSLKDARTVAYFMEEAERRLNPSASRIESLEILSCIEAEMKK